MSLTPTRARYKDAVSVVAHGMYHVLNCVAGVLKNAARFCRSRRSPPGTVGKAKVCLLDERIDNDFHPPRALASVFISLWMTCLKKSSILGRRNSFWAFDRSIVDGRRGAMVNGVKLTYRRSSPFETTVLSPWL
jgi:hypothetical protein